MVARIVSGKSIRGILNYNEHKVSESEAKLLLASGFPRDASELSFKSKLERFEKLTMLNERTKTNALHITLNFSRQDQVDDELLCQLAKDYMQAIGFGAQPFLVYRHFDAAHPHIHLATVNIDSDGNRIETHNIGKIQSEKARKEIEQRYGLIKAEDQKKEINFQLRKIDLERAIYGKRETKAAISSIVREVVGTYKIASLAELNVALGQFGVVADPGEEGTLMRSRGGLIYSLLNEKGERLGIPIKASSIYSSPTLKNLEIKFSINKEERKPYLQRIKHLLDKALRTAKNEHHFQELLHAQGLRILMRENIQGQVYGITFIDNATRIVVNGSTLGKEYSARAFAEKLNALQRGASEPQNFPVEDSGHVARIQAEVSSPTGRAAGSEKSDIPFHPASQEATIERLLDVAFYDEHDQVSFDPFQRKKRKKKRLQSQS
ncbi:relaxase/mobilization nuclease domain-containing protein [Chitinophaga polysaccharea]|uniref:relaxase/mobilization nuclease domain-containing protein n=1 Tax=Chitinophaga polysaccharea TaxID=1293035 RepID=UPI001159E275|nr:relaxase/mobilization nuclease domain-containing protein [Chitinophaga polysaccharea]